MKPIYLKKDYKNNDIIKFKIGFIAMAKMFFHLVVGEVKKVLKRGDGRKSPAPCLDCVDYTFEGYSGSHNRPLFEHKFISAAMQFLETGGELTRCEKCGYWRGK